MRRDDGYTLIELLVVILLITILAAIGLTLLMNQRAKAQDAEAKQHASNLSSMIEACHVDERDFRDCDGGADLTRTGMPIGPGRGEVAVTEADQDTYLIVSTSRTGSEFTVRRDATGRVRSCAPPGEGGCRTGSVW